MPLPDVRLMTPAQREIASARIKTVHDLELPRLKYWNYDLCRQHRFGWPETYWDADKQEDRQRTVLDRPPPGCKVCGIHFRRHQRLGISWLYFKGRALLADVVGSGKTTIGAGLIAAIRENHELDTGKKILVVCRPVALYQWQTQLQRMIPSIPMQMAVGTKREREAKYVQDWEVMLTGYQMLLRDENVLLDNFQYNLVLVDDVDPLRNRDTATSYTLKQFGNRSERCVIMTGTPLQKRLGELYSILEPLGGHSVFGSETAFKTRYVRSERITRMDPRTGRKSTSEKIIGYKNVTEFVQKLAPFAYRRTAADLDDVHLPEIVPNDVMLDLHPRQREKYEELKQGVLRILKSDGVEKVKQVEARGQLLYGAKICGGLATLGESDGLAASTKLDWIMDKLTFGGDLEDEKVVIFAIFKDTHRALQARLTAAGIGWEVIWGEERDKLVRHNSQERFWNDPRCRVLMGTQSIEQSLNLQVARHLINVDMILNPARMEQLAGRIRRDGSAFRHVFVHNLLTTNTQEARYIPLLEREQAIINRVWNEESELFDTLNPLELLTLITG